MPRLTEALGPPPSLFFKSFESASSAEPPPSSPKERPLNPAYSEDAPGTANVHGEGNAGDEESARAAYEARLAELNSPTIHALAADPELQRLAREATLILQDTLAPSFAAGLGEVKDETELAKSRRLRQAQTAAWDRFFRVQKGREDLLTTPRNELREGEMPPRSIWLAAKAEVEAGLGISHKAPEPLRRPRRG